MRRDARLSNSDNFVPLSDWPGRRLVEANTRDPAANAKGSLFVLVFENNDLLRVLAQPYMAALAQAGALLTDSHALSAPSQINYWAMTGGSTFGYATDADVDLPYSSVFDSLDRAAVPWKVYMENYPGACYAGQARCPGGGRGHHRHRHYGQQQQDCSLSDSRAEGTVGYVRKHNPAISYDSVRKDPARCARIVPAAQLHVDLLRGEVPDFALYVPNVYNDGHDTTAGYTDNYLLQTWAPLFTDRNFMRDRTVVLTYDEDASGQVVPASETQQQTGRIYTALFGPRIRPKTTVDHKFTHYGLLRTIEDHFGLQSLGRQDATARPLDPNLWRSSADLDSYLERARAALVHAVEAR